MSKIITQELIESLGIQLPERPVDEQTAFIEHLNATLDERIGTIVMGVVGPDRVDQVTEFAQAGNQAGIAELVATAAREAGEDITLQGIIDSEVDVMLGEIAENAKAVMAVSRGEPVVDPDDLEDVEDDLVETALGGDSNY